MLNYCTTSTMKILSCTFPVFTYLFWLLIGNSSVTCQQSKPPPAEFYLDTRIGSRQFDPSTSGTRFDGNNQLDEGGLFNANLPIKFIIHGWTENANKSYYLEMSELYRKSEDCNVFRVDYSAISGQNYLYAATSYGTVGNYVGEFIVQLKTKFNISLKAVHVIGHSLGGQVSGSAARRVFELTGERIQRISALDPAAPLFENNPDAFKLTRKDADIVDIVHTDAGVLGYKSELGSVDFFPNGGKRVQPGCSENDEDSTGGLGAYMSNFYCSHHKSIVYFSASILKDVWSRRCNSWREFRNGVCDQNERVLFGERMPLNATGNYYLEIDIDNEYIRDILLSSATTY